MTQVMLIRKLIYGLLLALFAVSLILAGIIFYSRNQNLKVIFLDVGQGDAILISEGNRQVLIDGGPGGKIIMEKLGKFVPFWDRNIEIVIATHPDQDHIAGLVDTAKNYKIGRFIGNGVETDSQIYQKLKQIIQEKNISELEGGKGMKIKWGDNVQVEILSPDGSQAKNNPKDTNAASIVSRLSFGDESFLFTGDISYDQEKELADGSQNVSAGYLKVSHHGSKYSTSQIFLDKIQPRTAIISVGADNRYGHPSPDVIARLEENRIEILRTDQDGDISYVCDDVKGCVLE